MEMPRPLMVITLNLHPFQISHGFLNVKWSLPHLNFWISNTYTILSMKKIVVKCEIEMRPAPPHFPWNLDTALNPKLCWPKFVMSYCFQSNKKVLSMCSSICTVVKAFSTLRSCGKIFLVIKNTAIWAGLALTPAVVRPLSSVAP